MNDIVIFIRNGERMIRYSLTSLVKLIYYYERAKNVFVGRTTRELIGITC